MTNHAKCTIIPKKDKNFSMSNLPLTHEWYTELEKQADSSFVNLPIEFAMRDYTYSSIAKRYLTFFRCDDNDRQAKLSLAKKFLKFIRSINKNRAKHELDESFFMCFQYFMDNFSDLLAKQDYIALETLSILTDGIDKSQFIEDVINIDELKKRVENLNHTVKQEEIIETEWEVFEIEYNQRNPRRLPATT